MLFIEDVEAHYQTARSAGAHISEELHVTIYGEKQYAAVDPEGHRWHFAEHVGDVSPEVWGAKIIAQPEEDVRID